MVLLNAKVTPRGIKRASSAGVKKSILKYMEVYLKHTRLVRNVPFSGNSYFSILGFWHGVKLRGFY